MCKYCEKEDILIKKEIISPASWGWGGDISIKNSEVSEDQYGLFIDRGFLRFVDLEDCNCIEAGEKIKIKFCPMCGNKTKEM